METEETRAVPRPSTTEPTTSAATNPRTLAPTETRRDNPRRFVVDVELDVEPDVEERLAESVVERRRQHPPRKLSTSNLLSTTLSSVSAPPSASIASLRTTTRTRI